MSSKIKLNINLRHILGLSPTPVESISLPVYHIEGPINTDPPAKKVWR